MTHHCVAFLCKVNAVVTKTAARVEDESFKVPFALQLQADTVSVTLEHTRQKKNSSSSLGLRAYQNLLDGRLGLAHVPRYLVPELVHFDDLLL